MKSYIYLLPLLLIFCFACKNKKEIGTIKNTKVISLAGTTWIEKGHSDEIYHETEIKFTDDKNGTMTFSNSTRMPASYPISYKQDGLKATIFNDKNQKVFNIKIKSNNVFKLISMDDDTPDSQYIRVMQDK